MQLLPLISRGLRLGALPAALTFARTDSRRRAPAAPAAVLALGARKTERSSPVEAGFESTNWPETQPCLYP